jgi:hypothetical protein
MAAVDNDGGGQRQMQQRPRRRRRPMAHKIGQQTMRGKEESGWGTSTALDKRLISPPGREHEKINKLSSCKKTFFSVTVCSVGFFAPAETANVPF